MQKLSVLITTDGTYPCYGGGVSFWCDQLIRQLSDIKFHVLAITYSPTRPLLFSPPPQVATCQIVPLWGTEEPGCESDLFSETYRRKLRVNNAALRDRFLDPFEAAVRGLLRPGLRPEALASGLLRLHEYFQEHDYAQTMRSTEAWDLFLRLCSEASSPEGKLTLDEATTCMRWLQRYLAILSVSYPRVDITHASMAGLAGIPGVLQRLSEGSRFLLTEHGIYLRELYISVGRMETSPRCKRFLFNLNEAIVRMNYYFADLSSTLCKFNKKWQIRFGGEPENIRIVPNGVDADRFKPGRAPARDRPTVLTMARIFPLKGIENLILAADLVRRELPQARFRILGAISDAAYYRTCADLVCKLGLAGWIEFGETADAPAAYHEADIYCLPSISEAMPYSVIEAMLSGCPVVATDVGGVAEVLRDTGLLVKPQNPQALAQALLFLLQGEEAAVRRQKLAAKALVRARAHYSLQKCSEGFRELYYDLICESLAAQVSAT